MKYIDNLLDWGDSLFQADTREAINEALQLYLLAQDILGPRPQGTSVREDKPEGEVHDFLEADKDVQSILAAARANSGGADSVFMSSIEASVAAGEANGATRPILSHLMTSFCVPENAEFVGYWDRVEDRLFKIRNSLNFAGVFRQLALFQPPISPGDLVAAVGQGASVSSAVSQLSFPVPHYRYDDVLGRAKEFTEMVVDFGSKLFDAIRDRDEERLTLLQASHEKSILTLTRDAIGYEITAARSAKRELEATKTTVADRKAHFDNLISGGLSALEVLELVLRGGALVTSVAKGILDTKASAAAVLPQITVGASGFGGSPVVIVEVGGEQASSAVETAANILGVVTDGLDRSSDMISTGADYHRRDQEWKHEQSQAALELEEIEAQMATADIQLAAAEHALVVHNRTEQHASEVESFHRSKFANESLFNWMASRLTTLYFQAYRVAYDTAKAAERALQYELPTTRTFIEPNNFDAGRRGLLAGEALSLQLAQLEKHQLDNDSRFQEIERTISLAEIDPEALLTLQFAGTCDFALPQALFDQDFPGHYFRVIKTLELTIETTANFSPHRGPHATLMQLGHRTLLEPDLEGVRYLRGVEDATPAPGAVRSDWRANQQIAVSKANRDHGMFVLNFFLDDRYFPFEGTGVVSNWRLELPAASNPDMVEERTIGGQQVEMVSVSDVLIHLRYTAAVDPGSFKAEVKRLDAARASN